MPGKKQWTKPAIDEVELQNEADVLAICWGVSNAGKQPVCRIHACAQ